MGEGCLPFFPKLKTQLCFRGIGVRGNSLQNFHLEGLSFGVSRAVIDGQRIRRRLRGLDVHASRVRRPDWIRLRLQLHIFRVRDSVAKLHRVAAMDRARIRVERLDIECLSTHLVQRRAVAFALFLLLLLSALPLDLPIFRPARKENPTDDQCNDGQNDRGI